MKTSLALHMVCDLLLLLSFWRVLQQKSPTPTIMSTMKPALVYNATDNWLLKPLALGGKAVKERRTVHVFTTVVT